MPFNVARSAMSTAFHRKGLRGLEFLTAFAGVQSVMGGNDTRKPCGCGHGIT